jgi:hypothetical protein
MPDVPQMDRLTGQLYHLPTIIGRLGISIAEAQKELNADYVASVSKLMMLTQSLVGATPSPETLASAKTMLESMMPSRYQFTETTLDFSADLSESKNIGFSAAGGAGMGAIVVNAAFTMGYGYDYRAAARVTSTLHARAADPEHNKALLERAATIKGDLAKIKDALPPTNSDDQLKTHMDLFKQLLELSKKPA